MSGALDNLLIFAEQSCYEFDHPLLPVPQIDDDGVGMVDACKRCSRLYREAIRAGLEEEEAAEAVRWMRRLQLRARGENNGKDDDADGA